MDYMKILKRAWSILWSYRMLWIFGVLVALTSGGSGGNSGRGANFNFNRPGSPGPMYPNSSEWRGLQHMLQRLFSEDMLGTWIGIGVALLCLVVVFAIIAAVVRYVSHTALIRMVDEHERSGEKVGFRQGWRWGWNRAAWRLFLIDLLISLPIIIIVLGILGCGALFLVMGFGQDQRSTPAIVIPFIGALLLVILVSLIVGVVISLIQPVIRRYAVLENAGVIDSIRGGLALIRRRFVDVFLMWLILVGLTIAYTIVLIPVVLILLLVATMLGGGLGFAVYYAVEQAASQGAAVVAGVLAGLPIFLLILVVPSVFLEGLRQVYGSTTWTLAYRELAQPPAAPEGAEIFTPPAPAETNL